MEPVSSISISNTIDNYIPSKHTLYIISISGPVRSWTTSHRYSDFDALHKQLSLLQETPEKLPKKSIMKFQNNVVEGRKEGLERYLQAILYSKIHIWRRSEFWQRFLLLPKTAGSGSIKFKTPKAIISHQWTQEIENLLRFSTDIQRMLIERDKTTITGDAGLSPTRKLQAKNRIRAAFDTYEQLNILLIESKSNNEISPAEFLRRENIMMNVKNQLESMSKAVVETSLQLANNSGYDKSDSRKGLFESKPKSSRQFGVIETQQTRVLDNSGLLELQASQMVQQDTVVSSLGEIIRRQKEIGLVISHELDIQNGLLDQVHDSVDRVEGTMVQADKKIKRIMKG